MKPATDWANGVGTRLFVGLEPTPEQAYAERDGASRLMAAPGPRKAKAMLYNFTGGNIPIPTPLIFDATSGSWHLPEPADYTDHTSRLRVSYERAVSALSFVGRNLIGDLPAGRHAWRVQ